MFEHIGQLFVNFGGFFLGMLHVGGGASTVVSHTVGTLSDICFLH